MSKKRSFFERLTGSMTLSNKHKFDDDDDADQNSKKSITAKLTPLNSEHKNKHHLKDGDDSDAEQNNDEVANLSVDVFESNTNVVVNAFVAGVDPNNIDVTITRNSISIRGHRNDEQRKSFDQIDSELFWGKFERDVVLTIDLEPDRAEAVQKQGLLTITVPKIDRDRRSTPKVKNV